MRAARYLPRQICPDARLGARVRGTAQLGDADEIVSDNGRVYVVRNHWNAHVGDDDPFGGQEDLGHLLAGCRAFDLPVHEC